MQAFEMCIKTLPEGNSPRFLHITSASFSEKAVEHTVPQALLIHISTLPSRGFGPFTRRCSPVVQFAASVDGSECGDVRTVHKTIPLCLVS